MRRLRQPTHAPLSAPGRWRSASMRWVRAGRPRAEGGARLSAFLAAGQHGDMGWLAERADQRSHPQALWPEARSVVALGLSYAPEGDPLATHAPAERGNVSVYARNRDYHDVVKGMLSTWRSSSPAASARR